MKLFDFISLFSSLPPAEAARTAWTLNTSNPGKLQEFERLFNRHGIALAAGKRDLPEIAADPVLVAVHKAAQVEEGVLVEDTSLEVEDAEIGIQVRSLLDRLEDYAGNKAVWRTLLAYRQGDLVYVYEGRVDGTIVHPRGGLRVRPGVPSRRRRADARPVETRYVQCAGKSSRSSHPKQPSRQNASPR